MLLRKDGVARAQSLMKMFAVSQYLQDMFIRTPFHLVLNFTHTHNLSVLQLACKADHNFLALEVAALMEDEMTVLKELNHKLHHHYCLI